MAAHNCGGIIEQDKALVFCAECGAFNRVGGTLPTGTDANANVDAWDAGELTSPKAPAVKMNRVLVRKKAAPAA